MLIIKQEGDDPALKNRTRTSIEKSCCCQRRWSQMSPRDDEAGVKWQRVVYFRRYTGNGYSQSLTCVHLKCINPALYIYLLHATDLPVIWSYPSTKPTLTQTGPVFTTWSFDLATAVFQLSNSIRLIVLLISKTALIITHLDFMFYSLW